MAKKNGKMTVEFLLVPSFTGHVKHVHEPMVGPQWGQFFCILGVYDTPNLMSSWMARGMGLG